MKVLFMVVMLAVVGCAKQAVIKPEVSEPMVQVVEPKIVVEAGGKVVERFYHPESKQAISQSEYIEYLEEVNRNK